MRFPNWSNDEDKDSMDAVDNPFNEVTSLSAQMKGVIWANSGRGGAVLESENEVEKLSIYVTT
jgi:hypothetical protein